MMLARRLMGAPRARARLPRQLRHLVAFAALGAPVSAWAQAPIARATLSPSGIVTVGQPVTLTVQVFVPSFFQGAPAYPDLDVDDAITIFNDRGTNISERVGRDTWAGQSRTYTIYPQRVGVYEISDISVEVRYRGADGNTSAIARAPAVRFEARIPPEAAGLDYFIAGSLVTLEESFDLRPDTVRVGDAFTRTVTTSVYDALSIVIPPLEIDSIPGIAIYPNQPRVDDTSGERGAQIVGTRVESVTYVMQDEGEFALPAIELAWWDVGAERLRRESVAGTSFVVIANPDLVTEFEVPPDTTLVEADSGPGFTRFSLRDFIVEWAPTFLAVVVLLTLVLRLLRRLGPGLLDRIETSKRTRAESEAKYFGAFRAATRSGDPKETANALMEWLDRRNPKPGPALFGDFANAANDPALDRETRALDASLYGPDVGRGRTQWSAPGFYEAVAKARRKSREAQASSDLPPGGLSPLNPRADVS